MVRVAFCFCYASRVLRTEQLGVCWCCTALHVCGHNMQPCVQRQVTYRSARSSTVQVLAQAQRDSASSTPCMSIAWHGNNGCLQHSRAVCNSCSAYPCLHAGSSHQSKQQVLHKLLLGEPTAAGWCRHCAASFAGVFSVCTVQTADSR